MSEGKPEFQPLLPGHNERQPAASHVVIPLLKTKVSQFMVEGMTCASCVKTIVSILESEDGISKAVVNLLSKVAVIKYDPSIYNENTLCELIVDIGFGARILEGTAPGDLKLNITWRGNLDSKSFKRTILEIDGVNDVELSGTTLSVRYEVDFIKGRDILARIEGSGFPIKVSPYSIESLTRSSLSHEAEIRKWRFLFYICIAFAVPTMLLMILHMFDTPAKKWLEADIFENNKLPGVSPFAVFMFLLATPVQFILGSFLYVNSYKSMKHCSPSMDVLIVIGTTVAYCYSLISIILTITRYTTKTTLNFETSVMLITFITLGNYIANIAKGKTSTAITKLMDLKTPTALVVVTDEGGKVVSSETIDTSLLEPGDLCKVLPSTGIPGDGVVVKGKSEVNESMLTGESRPVLKQPGDKVIAGTINITGTMIVKIESVGADTVLTQITKMVQDAQNSKPDIQKLGDKISGYFVPVVLFVAVVDFIVWYSLISTGIVPSSWIPEYVGEPVIFAALFAISVLVISCPCAIGLATPTAMMVGTGLGAKHGIFITNGEVIQRAKEVTAVVFDKTGTLTLGKPVVTDWKIVDGIEESEFFSVAASAELDSEHPIGKAIVDHAKENGYTVNQPAKFKGIEGKGIECEVNGKQVIIGTERLMKEKSIKMDVDIKKCIEGFEERGCTTMLCAVNGSIIGSVALRDPPRKEAKRIVNYLHQHSIETYMLTGDNQTTAETLASSIGISKVFSKVLPHEKRQKILDLQQDGHIVAMVGDGINDTPALAQADVGIAIGAGTDAAKATAEIVLMRSNLVDVLISLSIMKSTYNQIRMNFVWAFLYNTLAIPFASGLFFPLIKIMMPPWVAGLLMAFSSISVVVFSLKLKLFNAQRFYDIVETPDDDTLVPLD